MSLDLIMNVCVVVHLAQVAFQIHVFPLSLLVKPEPAYTAACALNMEEFLSDSSSH